MHTNKIDDANFDAFDYIGQQLENNQECFSELSLLKEVSEFCKEKQISSFIFALEEVITSFCKLKICLSKVYLMITLHVETK